MGDVCPAWSAPAGRWFTLSDVLDIARAIGRLFLAPFLVAVGAGVELARYGLVTAAAAAYLIFMATQGAVISWNRYQLRQAKRRFDTKRSAWLATRSRSPRSE